MKLLLVIGTRPEAIKMAGLVYELRRHPQIEWTLCSTGQHKTMLEQTLRDLDIAADVDLGLMGQAQGLPSVTAAAVERMTAVVEKEKPDWVLVQGDTTTAMASALAAFYCKVPVGHVEAGLRTYNRYSPWPEEINRRIISVIAARHYAPTTVSRDQLLREGFAAEDILVTGNTVIDALLHTAERFEREPELKARAEKEFSWLDPNRRLVLVTGHRRENFGSGLEQICRAIDRLASRGDVEIVYPVHLNPNVQTAVRGILRNRPNIHLIEPLSYGLFVWLMKRSTIILSDSGGIQEEAPSLGKPVLVMRDTSERPEAIAAGTCLLVGTSIESIVESANGLLDNPSRYELMSRTANPYGNGTAGHKIIEDLIACRR